MCPYHLASLPRVKPTSLPPLRPVTENSDTLPSTLLYNAGLRFLAGLRISDWGHVVSPSDWISVLSEAHSMSAQDLLAPEDQVICKRLCQSLTLDHGYIRHGYRRGYFAELCHHHASYFRYFYSRKVPTAILQSLQSLCEHEGLLQAIEQLTPQSNTLEVKISVLNQ